MSISNFTGNFYYTLAKHNSTHKAPITHPHTSLPPSLTLPQYRPIIAAVCGLSVRNRFELNVWCATLLRAIYYRRNPRETSSRAFPISFRARIIVIDKFILFPQQNTRRVLDARRVTHQQHHVGITHPIGRVLVSSIRAFCRCSNHITRLAINKARARYEWRARQQKILWIFREFMQIYGYCFPVFLSIVLFCALFWLLEAKMSLICISKKHIIMLL